MTLTLRTVHRLEVRSREPEPSPRLQAARLLGFPLQGLREVRLYFLAGPLTEGDLRRLAADLLADPVAEEVARGPAAPLYVEVALQPGVTDPPAASLLRAAALLGVPLEQAATGRRYEVAGDLAPEDLERLAVQVLSNPVVERHAACRPVAPPFLEEAPEDDTVETVPLTRLEPEDLRRLGAARRLALDPVELQAVQAFFAREGREPTEAELETLAQTWSEHCAHKTFRAFIDYDGPPPGPDGAAPARPQAVDGLLALLREATETLARPRVRSAFVDNAGIVEFDERFDLAFKVETHNHPSALEPFGGANTGVGGVIRDVLGVSARPIANTDVLCFAPPDLPPPPGVLHPRRIAEGVVHGIEDYGNKMGIPTLSGAVVYHPGYLANPLVFCGCLGLLPRGSHPTDPRPGDLLVSLGGRTGRDGLRGATFSSMEMDAATGSVAGSAVQIGNPIEEKNVMEAVLAARDAGLYRAITDCGAGGFSSAVGEMAATVGARVHLERAPLKYRGLRPWEIWLSEAQERMVLAVPPGNWERLREVCRGFRVEATVLGELEATGRLRVLHRDREVVDLPMDFLHRGRPRRRLRATWSATAEKPAPPLPGDPGRLLLQLLAHPTVASKEDILRRYDHEVQGGAAVRPLVGVGPGDAAVVVPLETLLADPESVRGVALAVGVCPSYTELDPYRMAFAAVDEAMRNLVAVGADPDQASLLDNFSWGNPTLPDRLGALVRCVQGCRDAALAYGAPFISGKDSLNNEFADAEGRRRPIPGTLVISALAPVPDVRATVTMDLKCEGSLLYLVGATADEAGGALAWEVAGREGGRAPAPVPDPLRRLRALHLAIRGGAVRACHDLSEGGLAVALAEMALAGGLGTRLDLDRVPSAQGDLGDDRLLFAETAGRFLVEVDPARSAAVEALLEGVPFSRVGEVGGPSLQVHRSGRPVLEAAVADLSRAFGGAPPSSGVASTASREVAPPSAGSRPRVLVMHAPGTNRDREALLACRLAGGDPEIVTVDRLLAREVRLADYRMLVLPGGFSYGDDLGAGRLWAADLALGLGEDLHEFVASGRPVLGICNGFQALVQAGVLPGGERVATLAPNQGGRFECRWVALEPDPASPCLFTRGLQEPLFCPVAHGEGRLEVAGPAALERIREGHLAPLRYAGHPAWPANPNGSVDGLAALTNPAGNVLGLMPHPEDHLFDWQHPRFHRGERGGRGLALFRAGIQAAKEGP